MNMHAIMQVLGIVAEAGGTLSSLAALAKRLKAGEEVTQAEIDQVAAETRVALKGWDAAAQFDRKPVTEHDILGYTVPEDIPGEEQEQTE